DRYALQRDNGDVAYIRFFNAERPEANLFQVCNQVTINATYTNRYDVTLLVNGLPLVQIELKRRGIEMQEAFNQIARYKNHSFSHGHGLFQFVQLFVISNGVDTKYFCNNPTPSLSYKYTCYWADEQNRVITELSAFSEAFLDTAHLSRMIGHYIVRNETAKQLMVLRPYQYWASEALIRQVR
ncbi:UNVERIFIED_CONTAM: hypothetical protein GTU68_011685, partial [Idotea baltica]|nr:hypothetical protein [Idotea baltica]